MSELPSLVNFQGSFHSTLTQLVGLDRRLNVRDGLRPVNTGNGVQVPLQMRLQKLKLLNIIGSLDQQGSQLPIYDAGGITTARERQLARPP